MDKFVIAAVYTGVPFSGIDSEEDYIPWSDLAFLDGDSRFELSASNARHGDTVLVITPPYKPGAIKPRGGRMTSPFVLRSYKGASAFQYTDTTTVFLGIDNGSRV